jgi:hypothetical protein
MKCLRMQLIVQKILISKDSDILIKNVGGEDIENNNVFLLFSVFLLVLKKVFCFKEEEAM